MLRLLKNPVNQAQLSPMKNSLNGFGIVITRPADQAKSLSAAIQQCGGEAILFPLIAIAPLAEYDLFEQAISALNHADWAIFISSNAVTHAMPRIIKQFGHIPKKLRFAAIGQKTAQTLASYGVQQVLVPQLRFDSETMLALDEMRDVSGKAIVIFRGLGGREILADTLKKRGAEVVFAECYQRTNPQADCALLAQQWQAQQCHAIIVTSSEAMRYLLTMTANGCDDWIRSIQICVNHARIAEEATGLDLQLNIASAPDDEAMLSCLQAALVKTNRHD
jgi:uroporphyrinogen-III synthase